MFKPKPRTLRQTIVRAVLSAVMITAAFGISFVTTGAGMAKMVTPEQGAAAKSKIDRDEALIVRLLDTKCKPYAEGSVPGHAVVHLPGKRPAYVSSHVGFELWGPDLKHNTADDLPGTLYDFCL